MSPWIKTSDAPTRTRDTGEVNLLQAVMNRSQGGCYICHWPIDIDASRRTDIVKGFELREARFRMLARKPFGPALLRFVAVCPDCEESHLLAKEGGAS